MKIFKNKYTSFYTSLSKKLYTIPLKDNFYVPQGVCSIDDTIVVSCYDRKRINNSVLFIFSKKEEKMIFLDGKMHCGGISYHKRSNSLFITGYGIDDKSFINRYDANYVLKSKNLSTVFVEKVFPVDLNCELYSTAAKHSSPSYLTIYNDYLFVGNFVEQKYFDKYSPIIKKYKILSTGNLSTKYEIIKNPFSNTQGICLIDYNDYTYYVISRSFGRDSNSIVNICRLVDNKFDVLNTIVFPSMLEQINIYSNNLVAIFESAAACFKRTCISNNDGVYLINFSKLLKCNDDLRTFRKGSTLFSESKNIDIKGNCGQN
ncbi:MAG: hypothetical protein IKH54_04555 [Bacilli bacterium]|nr:hypothetical protein [Bacilli bacterium]